MNQGIDKYQEVGLILKDKRESMGIAIEEVSKELVLNPEYVTMIESGNFDVASKRIYYYGYVGALARHFQQSESEKLDKKLLSYLIHNKPLTEDDSYGSPNQDNANQGKMPNSKTIKTFAMVALAVVAIMTIAKLITTSMNNSEEIGFDQYGR